METVTGTTCLFLSLTNTQKHVIVVKHELQEKLVWASLLKVGDMVKDCCSDKRTIKSIDPVEDQEGKVVDYKLGFANGLHCSAMHCCDRIREE